MKEEKDEGDTKKKHDLDVFSAKNITIQSSFELSFLVIGKEYSTTEFGCDVGILVMQALALTCIAQGMRLYAVKSFHLLLRSPDLLVRTNLKEMPCTLATHRSRQWYILL